MVRIFNSWTARKAETKGYYIDREIPNHPNSGCNHHQILLEEGRGDNITFVDTWGVLARDPKLYYVYN
jgi:hypothetical protein